MSRIIGVCALIVCLITFACVVPSWVSAEAQLYPAKVTVEHEDQHLFVEAEIIDRDAPAAAASAPSSFRALGSQNVDRSLSETHSSVSPVGGACKSPAGDAGVCKNVAQCSGQTFSGLCAGNSQIKCCVEGSAASSASARAAASPAPNAAAATASASSVQQCTYGGSLGECKEASTCTGKVLSGLCPGRASIKCCIASSNPNFAPSISSGGNNGRTRITQTTLQRLSETQHQLKWQRFKTLRRKTYATRQAERTAYLIFRENRVRIIYLNDRYGAGYALFKSSTPFTDISSSRFNAAKLGTKVVAPGTDATAFIEGATQGESESVQMVDTDIESEGFKSGDVYWKTFQTIVAEAAKVDAANGVSTDDFMHADALVELQSETEIETEAEAEQGPVSPATFGNSGNTVKGTMSVDYRPHMLSVRQQFECASCYAFATASVLEAQMSRVGIKPAEHLSTQWFLDCDPDPKQLKCRGGFPIRSINSLYQGKVNLNYESQYPYLEWPNRNGCTAPAGSSGVKVNNMGLGSRCTATPENFACDTNLQGSLLKFLKTRGPQIVTLDASNWQFWEGGIFPNTGCRHSWKDGNHAVALVGYGSENGRDFWLVQNSWSALWGEQGFMRIEADMTGSGSACGIANNVVWAEVGKV